MPEHCSWLAEVRDSWLLPQLGPVKKILEVGSGGGRWSRYFIGACRKAVLVDGTWASEAAIRVRFDWPGFVYRVSKLGDLDVSSETVDYAFSFDTFVHFHEALFWRYIESLGRVLKPDGVLHVHYARRFSESEANGECFQYHPEAKIREAFDHAGLRLTGREKEFGGGYGAVLVEAVKRPPVVVA